MSEHEWLQVSIAVTPAGIEPVCAVLDRIGYAQVEIVDDLATIQAFLAENGRYWDYVDPSALLTTPDGPYVRLYLAQDEQTADIVRQIRAALDALQAQVNFPLGRLEMITTTLQEQDWANSWKDYFHAIPIGRMVIKPPWEPDSDWPAHVCVDIEPGMTFGTGDHATTRLCLELLEKLVKRGDRVLDLGCGSGILAVAALKLGAAQAVLVDVDPNCLPAVRENMQRNGIAPDRYRVVIGDATRDAKTMREMAGQYELVVSNIVADVLLALMPLVPAHLAPGGAYLLSGIIDDRELDIRQGLQAQGFSVANMLFPADQPWLAMEARR